jgi:hypothetical protein
MLESTPFGFETLSTHLIKCAVAASVALNYDRRTNPHKVLSKIGFEVDERSTNRVWKKTEGYKALCSTFVIVTNETHQLCRRTRQLQVKLHIRKCNNLGVVVADKILSELRLRLWSMNLMIMKNIPFCQ